MMIYKIFRRSDYEDFLKAQKTKGALIDLKDGYIHFSTADTVEETANLHFADEDDIFLLKAHAEHFGDALKWEVSRGGVKFPHLYRELEIDHIISVEKIAKTKNGFNFSEIL